MSTNDILRAVLIVIGAVGFLFLLIGSYRDEARLDKEYLARKMRHEAQMHVKFQKNGGIMNPSRDY